ncbi:hypothetical protein OFC17_35450, partial [Escherichia coli]|nr:hypothetical protein [Escherichia coli]
FHGGNTGSNPVPDTNFFRFCGIKRCLTKIRLPNKRIFVLRVFMMKNRPIRFAFLLIMFAAGIGYSQNVTRITDRIIVFP